MKTASQPYQQGQKDFFSNLMQFIAKNRAIPDFLKNIPEDSAEVTALLKAIHEGDFAAKILEHEHCHLYLLYLIQQKKINPWHGMTVYVYLMGLMQCKTCTSDEISVEKMVDEEKMTAEGLSFLNSTVGALHEVDYKMDVKKFKNFITTLPLIEQTLLKVTFSRKRNQLFSDLDIATALVNNIPFIMHESNDYDKHTIWIPSSSVIQFVLQNIFNGALEMMPVFGRISTNTIQQLHSANVHPIALHSPFVKSNITEVHHYKPGPLLIWLHDIGHTFWGSMLTPAQRYKIFNLFIPRLEQLIKIAREQNNPEVEAKLQTAIHKASDFDLTNIRSFYIGNKLTIYLKRALDLDPSNLPLFFKPNEKDPFMELLNKMVAELAEGEEKELWQSLLQTRRAKLGPAKLVRDNNDRYNSSPTFVSKRL